MTSKDDFRWIHKAIESANDSILITDPEGNIQYVNPAFERTTGYSKEEVLGKNPSILKSGSHNDSHYKRLWNTILSGQNWIGVFVNKKKNGELYYDRASISPVFGDKGEITNFVSVKRNITEQKEFEGRLRQSEARTSAILKTIGEGIIVMNSTSKIKYANQEALTIFGYMEEELLGKNAEVLMPEEYRERHISGVKKYVEHGKSKILGRRLELEGVRKNGNVFSLELRVEQSGIDENKKPYFTAAIRDITERKRLEEDLVVTANELLHLNAFKDKMLSIISHDLRSPLTSSLGLLNLLAKKEDAPLSKRQKHMIEVLRASTGHQLKLVEDLISLSQLRIGGIEVIPSPINAMNIIDKSISMLKQIGKDKGVSIKKKGDGNIWIFVDEEKILSVINNLLTNAIKFTKPDGQVMLNVEAVRDVAVITVSDTGIGIEPERLENIFDLSQKTSTFGTDGEKGTGLGLSICRELTALNNGKFDLESKEGGGTTARLTFPHCAKPQDAD